MRDDEDDVPPRGLELVPLGPVDAKLLERVAMALSRRVAVPVRLVEAPFDTTLPRLGHRDQLDADKLLSLVEGFPRRDGHWTVGLAAEDMGHPIFTFFFGRAKHDGTAAVVSVHRLDPAYYGYPHDLDRIALRAALEALHELGHVAGLPHCEDNACVMRFCPSVEEIDNRGQTFCPQCHPRLPPAFGPSFVRDV